MILFLTSNIGGYKKINDVKESAMFFSDNMFLSNLKKYIKNYNKFVLISAYPCDYEKNDLYLKLDTDATKLSGMNFNEYIVVDNRNKMDVKSILKDCDLIILSGGNTKIQNKFFEEINLKEHLKLFNGVIVGISAGSINSATNVYDSPETKEDLNISPYLNGLGLTGINVEPHFKLNELDSEDKILSRNSILKESFNRNIIALLDGSYIICDGKINKVFGESYLIKDGVITKICSNNETGVLGDVIDDKIIRKCKKC